MSIEGLRQHCLSFPHVTEHIQWGDHLVFKVGGKCFLITSFEPMGNFASFKCTQDRFNELVERPGIIPAPYLARAKWVALESEDAVGRKELLEFAREAYNAVVAGLPKKVRTQLESGAATPAETPKRRSAPRKRKS